MEDLNEITQEAQQQMDAALASGETALTVLAITAFVLLVGIQLWRMRSS